MVKLARNVSRNWIALILAIGICTALNLISVAILYDAIRGPQDAGISENATQILTGWGGGIIGILGAVFGYSAGADAGGGRLSNPESPKRIDELDTRP